MFQTLLSLGDDWESKYWWAQSACDHMCRNVFSSSGGQKCPKSFLFSKNILESSGQTSHSISPHRDSSWGSIAPPSGCPGLLLEWQWSDHGLTLLSLEPDSPSLPTGTMWPRLPICRKQKEKHRKDIINKQLERWEKKNRWPLVLPHEWQLDTANQICLIYWLQTSMVTSLEVGFLAVC